ncbi:GntR family transcriptional regulator [Streptomyces sp. TRM 70351]|uniref:GntR family transcriptional regulator n=1 Tax=Streptomyces sp. TRM 70351 TaxID=3116552 RepID=UPI002E7C11B7|nr:GntR family transcriptional regulator [Streptomyces sp. TRM 70351]MEE1926845.1 GntR family transcriptional regulator [Streptomyces sp. TRM 70351]
MARTRTDPEIPAGPGAAFRPGEAAPVRPARSLPRSARGPRGEPEGREGEARGEHVHGGAPGPRTPRRHSVRGQVLAALREALLSGELAPGRVYSAPVLAERFGVSPTPVREAMQQLAGEGAVETVPNRGFRVAERTADDLAELAEVRALLEIPPLLRLARTLPPEHWQELRPLAEATVSHAARGDRPGYAEADRAFHGALLELTGNRHLVRIAEELRRRGARPPGAHGDLLAAAADHVALVDALAARDLPAAERVLRTHLAH